MNPLDGTDFPLAFKLKHLSNSALLCRHPMASGLLHLLLGSLCYGSVTYGRLLVVGMMAALSVIGVGMEERELWRNEQYRKFAEQVPSRMIPDYRILFLTEADIR